MEQSVTITSKFEIMTLKLLQKDSLKGVTWTQSSEESQHEKKKWKCEGFAHPCSRQYRDLVKLELQNAFEAANSVMGPSGTKAGHHASLPGILAYANTS